MRRVPFAAAVAPILLVLVFESEPAGSGRAHDPLPATPTFARDIRPIFAERCSTCHAAGGSAPMPLTTVQEIRPWARAVREQVLARRMPKWHAARGYGAFLNDPTLTPHEQALLVAWLDSGMAEGTPREAVAARARMALATPDDEPNVLRVVVPPQGDVGRILSRADRSITAWTFAPGDPLITAAVISVDGVPAVTWVAGDRPTRLPAGLGFPSGARIRVDVRRRPESAQERLFVPRHSVVTLLTAERTGLRRAWTEQVGCGELRTGAPADLLAVRPLLTRTEARLSVNRPGAPAAIVGWFREFDPLYPRTYWLLRPIEMAPDTRLVGDGPCRVELTLAPRAAVAPRPAR